MKPENVQLSHPGNQTSEITNAEPSKVFYLVYLLLLYAAFVVIYYNVFDSKISFAGDNTSYYILGKSLAQGHGYANIHLKDSPPANHFPPGYPFLIAVVMKLAGEETTAIKVANGLFLLLSIGSLFFLFAILSGNLHFSFVVGLLLLTNAHLLNYATLMMSEIPFMLFSILTITLFAKMDWDRQPYRNVWFYLFLICLGLTYYIRTIGISLVMAVLICMWFERRWKYLLWTIIGLVVMLAPWHIRSALLGGSGYAKTLIQKNPYRAEEGMMGISDWAERITENFSRYLVQDIPQGLFPALAPEISGEASVIGSWILGITIFVVAAYGLYKAKALRLLLLGYIGATFAILLLWPAVWLGLRFFVPVLPWIAFFFLFGIYSGILRVLDRFRINRQPLGNLVVPFLFLGLSVLAIPGLKQLIAKSTGIYKPGYEDYLELAKWSKQNIPGDALVSCRKTSVFYLNADRKVTEYLKSPYTDGVLNDLKNKGVSHVVIDKLGYSSTSLYLEPTIIKYPFKFKKVKTLERSGTILYEFNPELGYYGQWNNGLRNGYGSFVWDHGDRYQGEWKDGLMHGNGIYDWPDGRHFEGTFQNGKRHGPGVLRKPNGSITRGIWIEDTYAGESATPK